MKEHSHQKSNRFNKKKKIHKKMKKPLLIEQYEKIKGKESIYQRDGDF